MSTIPTLQLRKNKMQSLARLHPWIFSGALATTNIQPADGELVNVVDNTNQFVARGYYELGSIAVRILTFNEDEDIDANFWENRIAHAYELRKALGLASDNSCTYRLIHGEGDFIPGLVVDIYGDVAVMQAHTVGIHLVRHEIAQAIQKVYGAELSCIYYKSDTTLPHRTNIPDSTGILWGIYNTPACQEYGIRFIPDIEKGQKTGFFIDQRENRRLLERYAHNRRVLNVFCYTGGFSLYALRSGATQVVSVDSSPKAIDLTYKNVELNFPNEISNRHKALAVDAFKYLENMEYGEYDLIVLDPPAFAKHRGVATNALQGYRRINTEAIKKIAPGGILFTFSCSQAITATQFRQAIFTASLAAKRKIRILHFLSQPADHPISMYHPEGEYLKGLVLYVE